MMVYVASCDSLHPYGDGSAVLGVALTLDGAWKLVHQEFEHLLSEGEWPDGEPPPELPNILDTKGWIRDRLVGDIACWKHESADLDMLFVIQFEEMQP